MTSRREYPARLNLGKNVRFAIAEFALNVALVVFAYRLVIAHGGLEAVGVWATLFAWTNLIRLGDPGVADAAVRFVAHWDLATEGIAVRRYAETALLTNVVQFVVLGALAFVLLEPRVGRLVGDAHATTGSGVLPWMILAFCLANVAGTLLGILQGLHLGYRRSQLLVLGRTAELALVVLWVPSHGLVGWAAAQAAQQIVVILLAWMIVRRGYGGGLVPSRFDGSAFMEMLRYSVKIRAASLASGLREPVSKMLVAEFGGMQAQGIFELAYKTVMLPRNLVGAAVTATVAGMTALYRERRDELLDLYRDASRRSALAMGVALCGLIGGAPLVSYLWLGDLSTTYWLYVSILALGFYLNALGMPAYLVGVAVGQMRYNVLTAVGEFVTLALLGGVLGMYWSVLGVVVANAFAVGLMGLAVRYANAPILHRGGQGRARVGR